MTRDDILSRVAFIRHFVSNLFTTDLKIKPKNYNTDTANLIVNALCNAMVLIATLNQIRNRVIIYYATWST